MTSPLRTLTRVTCILGAMLTTIGGVSGCYSDGGIAYSLDRYSYVSRPWQPLTVTLKDTRTGQDFWSVDVPVGKMLIVSFSDTGGTDDGYTPSSMTWGLEDSEFEYGVPTMPNTLPVPPANARRVEVAIRPTPELPESMVTATRGTVRPARPATYSEPSAASGSGASSDYQPISEPSTPAPRPPTTPAAQPGVALPPPPPPAAPRPTPPATEPPINLPDGK